MVLEDITFKFADMMLRKTPSRVPAKIPPFEFIASEKTPKSS